VTKLLRRFRGHSPDGDALSALLDSALAPEAARALEAHLGSCPACAARLEELRRVRSALASLPDVTPPRTFALQPARLQEPARAPAASPWMRMAPVLSAAAVVVLAVLVGFDVTRGGDGDATGNGAFRLLSDSQGEMAADSPDSAGGAPAGAVAPGADDAAATQPAPAASEATDGATAPTDTVVDHGQAEATASAVAGEALAMRNADAADADSRSPEVEATRGEPSDEGEDGLDWLLVAQVAIGAVALVAGAYTVGMWFQRRFNR
jgi:hypothetical protein